VSVAEDAVKSDTAATAPVPTWLDSAGSTGAVPDLEFNVDRLFRNLPPPRCVDCCGRSVSFVFFSTFLPPGPDRETETDVAGAGYEHSVNLAGGTRGKLCSALLAGTAAG
jgi:hypothetical protein